MPNHYNKVWENQRPWLHAVFGDKGSANCSYCKCNIKIDKKGVTALSDHEATAKHLSHAKQYEKQRLFDDKAVLSPNKVPLTHNELITQAEVLEALKCVESNRSFASANGDNERFQKMFPDSVIAKGYHQSETKMKYNIQYGIASYVKDLIKKDYSEKPFTFKFDETTTIQVKKQYDAYVSFYSDESNKITTLYCGSLFVGHCTSDDLMDHFFHFMDSLDMNTDYLLNIGMDGPNVNRSFERKLQNELKQRKNTSFISLGSCNLHCVNNAFGKGMGFLKAVVDLDQVAIDLHFFFKLSSARREDYVKCSEITEVMAEYMVKHCCSRWLSIEKVLVRIIEQFENLKEYFLVFLPKQKNFVREIRETLRYKRIVTFLNNKSSMPYMTFVVFMSSDFKSFNLIFQSESPMIHILHPKMVELLKGLLNKFIDPKHMKKISSIKDLIELDLDDESKHKVKCEIGTKAISLLTNLDPLESKAFYKQAKKFIKASAYHLQQNSPLGEQVLIDLQYLHPLKRTNAKGLNAIGRLTSKVVDALGDIAMKKVFNFSGTKFQLIDLIKKEFSEYQSEHIRDTYYLVDTSKEKKKTGRKQKSYWKYAYNVAGVDPDEERDEDTKFCRIDEYWAKVYEMVDGCGKRKYAHLWALVRCLLSLSHGNADPERGFSLNKFILDVHGSSLSEAAIEALRFVKDFIHHHGGTVNVPITKQLLTYSKNAHQKYDEDMKAQKAIEEEKEKERNRIADIGKDLEKEKKDIEEREQLDRDIESFKIGVQVAEQMIADASAELSACFNKKTLDRKDVQIIQSKLSAGVKRKNELSGELEMLLKKKK